MKIIGSKPNRMKIIAKSGGGEGGYTLRNCRISSHPEQKRGRETSRPRLTGGSYLRVLGRRAYVPGRPTKLCHATRYTRYRRTGNSPESCRPVTVPMRAMPSPKRPLRHFQSPHLGSVHAGLVVPGLRCRHSAAPRSPRLHLARQAPPLLYAASLAYARLPLSLRPSPPKPKPVPEDSRRVGFRVYARRFSLRAHCTLLPIHPAGPNQPK